MTDRILTSLIVFAFATFIILCTTLITQPTSDKIACSYNVSDSFACAIQHKYQDITK
jgi:hypothetical protein